MSQAEEAQNRRTASVGRDCKDHLLPSDQLAQGLVQLGLECLQGWDTDSLLQPDYSFVIFGHSLNFCSHNDILL